MSAATMNEMERLKEERDAAIEQMAYWRERAVAAEGREQALAAHVEHVRETLEDTRDTVYRALCVIDDGPTTSITCLKAEWQAEALETVASISDFEDKPWDADRLRQHVAAMRRQAEGCNNGHN